MEDPVAPFLLLNLPSSDQKRVLRCCLPIEQVVISLLSKKAASLVKSLKISHMLCLVIENPIKLNIELPEGSYLNLLLSYTPNRGEENLSVGRRLEHFDLEYIYWVPQEEERPAVQIEDEDGEENEGGDNATDEEDEEMIDEKNDAVLYDKIVDGKENENVFGEEVDMLIDNQEEGVLNMEHGEPEKDEASEDEDSEIEDEEEQSTFEEEDVQITIRSVCKTNLRLRELILHVQNIYNCSDIGLLRFNNESLLYNLPSIKTALCGVRIGRLAVEDVDNNEQIENITKLFPSTGKICIGRHYRPKSEYLQRLLLSNYYYFSIEAFRFSYFGSLDKLLSINASTIDIYNPIITDKILNRFLKLWVRGAMPRLKLFRMYNNSPDNVVKKDRILLGIKATENEKFRIETFEDMFGRQRTRSDSGWNIMNSDGVEATIEFFEYKNNVRHFKLYVWSE